LAPWTILRELEVTEDINIALFNSGVVLLFGLWMGAKPQYLSTISNEVRVATQIRLTVVLHVPFGLVEKIFGIQESLDPFRVVLGAVGNSKGMIISNSVIVYPFCNILRVLILDIAR